MAIDLNFPAGSVPVDQFDNLLERRRRAVRQQAPFDRFNALGHADFACHDAGGADASCLAIRYFNRATPQLLVHRARRLLVARRHAFVDALPVRDEDAFRETSSLLRKRLAVQVSTQLSQASGKLLAVSFAANRSIMSALAYRGEHRQGLVQQTLVPSSVAAIPWQMRHAKSENKRNLATV